MVSGEKLAWSSMDWKGASLMQSEGIPIQEVTCSHWVFVPMRTGLKPTEQGQTIFGTGQQGQKNVISWEPGPEKMKNSLQNSYVFLSKWQISLQMTTFPSHQMAELPNFSCCAGQVAYEGKGSWSGVGLGKWTSILQHTLTDQIGLFIPLLWLIQEWYICVVHICKKTDVDLELLKTHVWCASYLQSVPFPSWQWRQCNLVVTVSADTSLLRD